MRFPECNERVRNKERLGSEALGLVTLESPGAAARHQVVRHARSQVVVDALDQHCIDGAAGLQPLDGRAHPRVGGLGKHDALCVPPCTLVHAREDRVRHAG